ncbi:MAG: RsmD family RNA methyltransferase [Promethearchaeota archaeon]
MKKTSTQIRFLKNKGFSEPDISLILKKVKFLRKGFKKFPRASQMQYTESSIAQASSLEIAKYRTWKVFSKLGKIQHSIDLCGGIGGDAIAAGLRWKVMVVEKDKSVFDMLEHNLEVYKVQNNVTSILGDIYDLLEQSEFQEVLKKADFIFFDPSRREDGKRTVKIEEYIPPLSLIEQILQINQKICVKISPGVDIYHIPYECDIEVVSLKGEVKEIMLWFGDLMENPGNPDIIATKLPEKLTLKKELHKYTETSVGLLSNLKKYLYEPDPAAIKAHLINELATTFKISTLHPQVAYLTSEKYTGTPWLKTYQVIESCPVDIPLIKKLLKKHEIHRIDCKARGLTLDLHKIQKELNSKGKNIGLVIFTWINNKKTAIIAQYLWDFT